MRRTSEKKKTASWVFARLSLGAEQFPCFIVIVVYSPGVSQGRQAVKRGTTLLTVLFCAVPHNSGSFSSERLPV